MARRITTRRRMSPEFVEGSSPDDPEMTLDDSTVNSTENLLAAAAPPPPEGGLAAPAIAGRQRRPTDADRLETLKRWANPKETDNLLPEIVGWQGGDEIINRLGLTATRQLEIDERSRSDWEARTRAAMDLAMQVTQGKMDPWPDASNVIYPLVSVAAIQFQSRAYPQIIDGPRVVKCTVAGEDKGKPFMDPATGQQATDPTGQPMWEEMPGGKQARADRIGGHMSWQLLHEQPEWEPEEQTLLIILPIVGCIFRKTYRNHEERRNASVLVLAQDLVINYRARSLGSAPRVSELVDLYPHEVEEMIRSDYFIDHEPGIDSGADGDEDAPIEYVEQDRRLDLDDDGYAEPYTVTIARQLNKVVRVSPRFDPDGIVLKGLAKEVQKIHAVQRYTQFNFLPNPDGGVYGVGLGQLLQPINDSINTTINQLFDAGTAATMGGGFIGKSLGIKAGVARFTPGEFKMVNAIGANVRDSVVPLTMPGPSAVMFSLLEFLVGAAKELGSNTEVLSGNQRSANVPATTTLALIEQGLKVFSSVFKGIYRSHGSEFQKLARLNRIYMDAQVGFQAGDDWKVVHHRDYLLAGSTVRPVADPVMVSDAQTMVRAQALMELINNPRINVEEVLIEFLSAMKYENPKRFIAPQKPDPTIQAKSIELALSAVKIRAQAIAHLAAAMKSMAEADAKVTENYAQWMNLQMENLRMRMDALGSLEEGAEDGTAAGPQALPAPV